MEKLTKPFVNINGNDGRALSKELIKAIRHIRDAEEALAMCQYDDGRNSKDEKHRLKMREEKRELRMGLNDTIEKLTQLVKDIRSK